MRLLRTTSFLTLLRPCFLMSTFLPDATTPPAMFTRLLQARPPLSASRPSLHNLAGPRASSGRPAVRGRQACELEGGRRGTLPGSSAAGGAPDHPAAPARTRGRGSARESPVAGLAWPDRVPKQTRGGGGGAEPRAGVGGGRAGEPGAGRGCRRRAWRRAGAWRRPWRRAGGARGGGGGGGGGRGGGGESAGGGRLAERGETLSAPGHGAGPGLGDSDCVRDAEGGGGGRGPDASRVTDGPGAGEKWWGEARPGCLYGPYSSS